MPIEYLLLVGATVVLVSITIAKLFDNLGVPTLLLFLGVGMLAGSEGPGAIYFDDAGLAQSIGIIALMFILFAGGFDTRWSSVKSVAWEAVSLSTVGVLLTAVAVGLFVHLVLGVPLLAGMLLGAVVSSTDAAAVFSVLRSKNVTLRGKTKPLLELESGSNDPMAVFLTVGILELMTIPGSTWTSIAWLFVVQMGLGGVIGFGLGHAMVFVLNRLNLAYDGIYSVFALACAALIFGVTSTIGGSGFLAVYVAGLIAGKSDFIQKRTLLRFFDGLAWLSQIAMFVTLGLLVYPSHLMGVTGFGLLISGFLMFIARPLSVFLTLLPAKLGWNEKAFVSWVGLRGAVPIVLATFPLLAGVPDAEVIFNVVFFIVLTSALLQGWSIPLVAKWLRVDAPIQKKRRYPIEFAPMEGVDTELVDLIIPYHSDVAGKAIIELGMPSDSLIILISRGEDFIVPSGGTILREGDAILVLVNKQNLPLVREIIGRRKEPERQR